VSLSPTLKLLTFEEVLATLLGSIRLSWVDAVLPRRGSRFGRASHAVWPMPRPARCLSAQVGSVTGRVAA